MEKIQIKSLSGSVIFEHEAENNTVKLTVEEAVKNNVILANANLAGAELDGANLYRAELIGTVLVGADLTGVNLSCANLTGSNLSGSNLSHANLSGSNLSWVSLSWAELSEAELSEAVLTGSNTYGAHIGSAKNIPFIPLACPSEGAFIGWKKVKDYYLVKLQIPEDARRLSATTRKCRCDKALVLDITSLNEEKHFDEVVNYYYGETIYKVGEIVHPDSFDENRWNDCSHGIHFFINKEDAIKY